MNKSTSPVTEMLSGKYKIFLTVGLSIMLGIDIIAVAVFLASGIDTSYLVVPLLMLVVDAVYLLGVIVSNQRFKYARSFFVGYVVLNSLLFIIGVVRAFSPGAAVFALGIAAVWTTLHVLGILTAVVTYVYAAKLIKKWRPAQFVLSVVLSCVVVLSCGILYSVFLFGDGYFGQGNKTRALIYNYTTDSECEVTGVVYGNGDSIVVPYEFNGHKVTSVSANVLTSGVKSITLNCSTSAALFADIDKYMYLPKNITFYVDKDNVDAIKQKFYGYAVNGVANTFIFGNMVRPAALDKDEVCITFDYDSESYSLADGNIMPTWYGKKDEVFSLNGSDIDYVQKSNINSDEDLFERYNINGYIMSELKANDKAIVGANVNKSVFNVPVRFQRIYRVYVANGNDTVYNVADHFTYSVAGGVTCNYKLTVADNADRILDCFDRGDAFTRNVYKMNDGVFRGTITSLSQTLKDSEDSEVTIAPYYSLVQPKVTISKEGDADIIYGDDYTLTAEVTHPLSDFEVSYEWYNSNLRTGTDKTLTKRATGIGSDRYSATAIVSAPKVTSLSSANAAEISVNVVRRPLTVVWTKPSAADSVYDGTEKVVTAELTNTVESDVQSNYIYLLRPRLEFVSAGTYMDTARLSGFNSNNYYIADGETCTYTVYPRPTALIWDEQTEFEYNGDYQCPVAHATDLAGHGLGTRYTGDAVDVGEYTVIAEIVDTNYTIDKDSSNSIKYSIYPKTISEITWQNTDLTYNGKAQAPTASAFDVKGMEMNLVVTGTQVDANAKSGQGTYTATASSPNKNYTVNPANATTEFTIAQFGLKAVWSIVSLTLTYDGTAQKPRAVASDENGKPINLDVSVDGEAVNVGESYTATAIVPNDNYKITENETTAFSIKPLPLTVTWNNLTRTYSGESQAPTATAKGENDRTLTLTVNVEGEAIDVGNSYTAKAVAPNDNYKITENEQTTFAITPYGLTVNWGTLTLTYNGESQAPTASATGVKGRSVTVAVSGAKINAGTNYTATASVSDSNYEITGNKNCYFSIAKKTVMVSIDDVTIFYGETPSFTFNANGIVGVDTDVKVEYYVDYTADGSGHISVGSYQIKARLVGDTFGNYTIEITKQGMLTVNEPEPEPEEQAAYVQTAVVTSKKEETV